MGVLEEPLMMTGSQASLVGFTKLPSASSTSYSLTVQSQE